MGTNPKRLLRNRRVVWNHTSYFLFGSTHFGLPKQVSEQVVIPNRKKQLGSIRLLFFQAGFLEGRGRLAGTSELPCFEYHDESVLMLGSFFLCACVWETPCQFIGAAGEFAVSQPKWRYWLQRDITGTFHSPPHPTPPHPTPPHPTAPHPGLEAFALGLTSPLQSLSSFPRSAKENSRKHAAGAATV